jgi:hypothetical protein
VHFTKTNFLGTAAEDVIKAAIEKTGKTATRK